MKGGLLMGRVNINKTRLILETAKTKLMDEITYYINKYYSSTSHASREFFDAKIKSAETRLKGVCTELENAYRV
jgi:hypothetical protein